MRIADRHSGSKPIEKTNAGIYLLAGLFALLLSSCVPPPDTLPETTTIEPSQPEPTAPETQPEPEEEDIVITHAFEEDDPIIVADDPQTLVEKARQAPFNEAPALYLSAISGFIEIGQIATAQTLINQIATYPLSEEQQISLQLQRTKLAQIAGKHEVALRLLTQINTANLSIPIRSERLLLIATSQQALEMTPDAVMTLLARDPLTEQQDRIDNQRQIVNLLQSMDPLNLSLLRENISDTSIHGWIALTDILQSPDQNQRRFGLEQWRRGFPVHPIEPTLFEQYLETSQFQRYRQVALLLPMTSPFGSAAKAFYDGFMAARNEDIDVQAPFVTLHDIGNESGLSTFYYQAAVNEGAEFIVGPLGRQSVNTLLESQAADIPTLVISEVPQDQAKENLYGISLSPEKEAQQVAVRAYADGHRQALVFRVDSGWGQRVADAFSAQWEALGGAVVKNSSFPTDISDYSRIIQRLLGLDKSVARHRLLNAQVGVDLKFTPRRRDDMDFLFLAANASQARLVVPQLRFFQAHNLPMYATSYVFSGEPDPTVDADLDGLIFGEMDWILNNIEQYKADVAARLEAERQAEIAAQEETTSETQSESSDEALTIQPDSQDQQTVIVEADQADLSSLQNEDESDPAEQKRPDNPYVNSTLSRLYALGFESYRLIPRLNILRKNSWVQHRGKTMTISVDEDGNVERHPRWVRFNEGLLEPLPQTTISSQATRIQ